MHPELYLTVYRQEQRELERELTFRAARAERSVERPQVSSVAVLRAARAAVVDARERFVRTVSADQGARPLCCAA